jgi:hypothetical protein
MLWIERQLAAVYKTLQLKCEPLVSFICKQQNKLKLNCAVKANITLAISQVCVSTQTQTTLVLSIYSRLHVSAVNVNHHQWEPKNVVCVCVCVCVCVTDFDFLMQRKVYGLKICHICLSTCLGLSARNNSFPAWRVPLNIILELYAKRCRQNSSSDKIRQK